MTDLHVAGSALELTNSVAAKPELAGPLLELLKAAGGDLAKLQGMTATALSAAKEALPQVATTVSELEQFKFSVREDGVREFIVPKGMSIIQAFEILNTEAKRLGINPAIFAQDFDWYKQNTSAGVIDNEKDTTVILIPLAKGSLGKNLSYMKTNFILIDEGHIALANALEWILSKGKVDSFEGYWIRGKVSGCALNRFDAGVDIRWDDGRAVDYVGCSSSPNKKS